MLWTVLLHELGEWCCTSTSLDLKKAQVRFEHEGVSFLTITLPAFCKDFEKSLEDGKVSRDLFTGFKWKGGLPLFLGGFLDRVFDRGTGLLLGNPDVDSIFAVRQLTLSFGKIFLECSDERKRNAIEGYLSVERNLKDADRQESGLDVRDGVFAACTQALPDRSGGGCNATRSGRDFARVAHLLFRDVFTKLDRVSYDSDWTCTHGPGSTADHLLGNQKWNQVEWPVRLEREFPFGEHALGLYRDQQRRLTRVRFLEPGEERPVRVTLVPKTLKTPRIIAIEPTAMQYAQQGMMQRFVDLIETHKVLGKMIGFTDQAPNQEFARYGSLSGELATLDMSEASDRVSNRHVRWLFTYFPHLNDAVDACRSRKADVPVGDGMTKTIRLSKFASMGSALTFPMEAMVFLTLIFLGIEREQSSPLTRRQVKLLSGQVRVYGDDIVVPVRYVPSVIRTLHDFGHKVNTGKSFWNGKFRESCGREYYDGHDVSITRVRRVLPSSRADAPEIISTVAMRNQFYNAGLWRTAKYLDGIIVKVLGPRNYPVLGLDHSSVSFVGINSMNETPSNGSPLLGRQSIFRPSAEGFDPDYQYPLARGWVVKTNPPESPLDGDGALLKWFLKRGEQPFADRNHLERSGRPQTVNIKLRFGRPW